MQVPKARKLKNGTWFIQLRLGGESFSISEKRCVLQAQYVKSAFLARKRESKKKEQSESESPTLSEAIDSYIAKRDAVLSPATIQGYRVIQRNRFQGIMNMSLSDLKETDWQEVCNQEAKQCSAKTLENSWWFLSSVIAASTGYSLPSVTLPQIIPNEHPFLEPEQIKPFVDALHGTEIEIPALLALHSLRRSDIIALKWENIDFTKRIIRIRGSVVPNEDEDLVFKKENKTETSRRNIPIMIDELYDALKLEYQHAKLLKKDDGFIYHSYPDMIRRKINKLCDELGFPRVGVHGLRHSFASLCYHLKIPTKYVKKYGGWKDEKTVQKIYTHFATSDANEYTDSIKAFFSGKSEIDLTQPPK